MAKEEITSDVRKYLNQKKIKAQHIKIYGFQVRYYLKGNKVLLYGGKHITLNADIRKFKRV